MLHPGVIHFGWCVCSTGCVSGCCAAAAVVVVVVVVVCNRYNVLVVHAALVPGVSLEQQDLSVLTKVRDLLQTPDGRSGPTAVMCTAYETHRYA